jgi:hypothetical protein
MKSFSGNLPLTRSVPPSTFTFPPCAFVSIKKTPLRLLKTMWSILLQRSVDLVQMDGLKPIIRESVLFNVQDVYEAEQPYLTDLLEATRAIATFCRNIRFNFIQLI